MTAPPPDAGPSPARRFGRVPRAGIAAARVLLRPLDPSDLRALEAVYADAAVTRFLQDGPFPPAEGRQVAAAILRNARNPRLRRGTGTLAVVERASGRVIGTCGVQPLDAPGVPRTELSYVLGRAWWGRGLATEAAGALAGFAFAVLGVPALTAVVHPDNRASARVLAKLGFRADGLLACYGGTFPCHILTQDTFTGSKAAAGRL